jgi:hypothetical protein
MINFSVTGDIEIQARLGAIVPSCITAALVTIGELDQELARYIVEQKLSGQVLNKVTGTLQSSIRPIPAVEADGRVTGGVEQDSGIAPYGKSHEFGAYIPAMSGLMHFTDAGNEVFTTHTRGHRLPVRSFMRSALREFKPIYEAAMIRALESAVFAAWEGR